MTLATRVQILDEAVFVSLRANALGKDNEPVFSFFINE